MTRARSLSQLANENVFTADANNSRVGIGSTIPDVKLDVGGDLYADNLTINNLIGVAATFSGVVSYEDVTNVDSVGIITAQSYVSIADSIVHTGDTNTAIRFPAANTFTIETAGQEALRVDSSQKVGIGSQSPGRLLDIFGDSDADGGVRIKNGGGHPDLELIGNQGNVYARFSEQGGTDPGRLELFNSGGSVIRLATDAASYFTGGNVGIGTDIPSALLHVEKDGTSEVLAKFESNLGTNNNRAITISSPTSDNASEPFIFNTGNSYEFQTDNEVALHIDSNGNVGIGTDNPIGDLSITGANGSTMEFQPDIVSGTNRITNFNRSTSTYKAFRLDASQHEFLISGTEKLRIDSSGRVMIDTANMQSEGITANLQVRQDSSGWNIEALRSANTIAPPRLWFGKSRGSATSQTVVSDDDYLGEVRARGYDGTNYIDSAAVAFEVDAAVTTGNMPGRISFYTSPDSGSLSERLRIDSRGSFHFKNGLMIENGLVSAVARTGTQNVALDSNGMVIYITAASTGTWKPNFVMSSGDDINDTMGTGDVISPTMIVAKGSTAHYADTIQVDGADVTPEWLGGAPTDGGGSGTFDVYSYTIIKTGDDTFKCFGSVSTYE